MPLPPSNDTFTLWLCIYRHVDNCWCKFSNMSAWNILPLHPDSICTYCNFFGVSLMYLPFRSHGRICQRAGIYLSETTIEQNISDHVLIRVAHRIIPLQQRKPESLTESLAAKPIEVFHAPLGNSDMQCCWNRHWKLLQFIGFGKSLYETFCGNCSLIDASPFGGCGLVGKHGRSQRVMS